MPVLRTHPRPVGGVIALVTMLLMVSPAQAQDLDVSKALSELRAPATPAFTMLGVQPSSVERPSTGHALIVSLVSATSGANGLIPENYALEVAPYWLSVHNLPYTELYKGLRAVEQTLAISYATKRIDATDTTSASTQMALGLRTLVFTFEPSSVHKNREGLFAELGQLNKEFLSAPASDRADVGRRIDEKVKAIQESYVHRLMVEFASGFSAEFPRNVANQGRHLSTAAWLTASYSVDKDLSVLGVARYRRDGIPQGGTRSFESGGRVLWSKGSLGLSAEGLVRRISSGPGIDSSRLAGILEYQVTSSVYIDATFGRDFETSQDRHPLLSLLGLKWGLGNQSRITDQKS